MNIKELDVNKLAMEVNDLYKKGFKKMIDIAEELQKDNERENIKSVSASYISKKLNDKGYVFKDGQYVQVSSENLKDESLDNNFMEYLLFSKFDSQIAGKVNKKTLEEFNKLCSTKYASINKNKLLSLALEEFVRNHK